MKREPFARLGFNAVLGASLPMLLLLGLPIFTLLLGANPAGIEQALRHPSFWTSFWLSMRTSCVSIVVIIVFGTPLAWWLATSRASLRRMIERLVELPIVLPPAVLGVALLQTFGRQGLLGELVNVQIPFTSAAVVIAQITVAAPFYVQSAAAAFRRVDRDLVLVARTLGQSHWGAMLRVVIPLSLPGLIGGTALAWARALGEFGATLLFAGNFIGKTQTLPLAIYVALENDVALAVSLSLLMAGVAAALLVGLTLLPSILRAMGILSLGET